MSMITEKDREFFRNNGYMVVKNVVPQENCDRAIDAIWECMGRDPNNKDEWYAHPKGMDTYLKHQNNGVISMYHHQAMWNNRQHPRMYQAFKEFWNHDELFVSIDRIAMKPPKREGYEMLNNSFIHWDLNVAQLEYPIKRTPFVQGMLMLADTAENQGGFQCVPSLYLGLEEFLEDEPMKENHRVPTDLKGHEIVKVPGKAGDLIIWDALLLHGNGENHNTKPRYAQAITMGIAKPEDNRKYHVDAWEKNYGHPGKDGLHYEDPREWETKTYKKPADLTPLGRKLLGADSWF